MEVKNLMSIMVVALVGAVILAGFLPVIGATQSEAEKTVNLNTNYQHTMNLINSDVVIEIDYTNGNSEIIVNVGDTVYNADVSTVTGNDTWLFYSDICSLWVDRVADVNLPVYAFKSTGYTGNLSNASSVFTYDNATKEVTLSIGGVQTYTDVVKKFAYVYSGNDGEYGYFMSTQTFTINSKDTVEIFQYGGWWANSVVAYTSTAEDWYNSNNTPIGGLVLTKDSTPTEYDATIVSNQWVDNGNSTYTRNGSTVLASYNGDTGDFNVTSAIAPIQYIAYENNATSDVIGLLPLILAIGLLMFVVGAILIRRV